MVAGGDWKGEEESEEKVKRVDVGCVEVFEGKSGRLLKSTSYMAVQGGRMVRVSVEPIPPNMYARARAYNNRRYANKKASHK